MNALAVVAIAGLLFGAAMQWAFRRAAGGAVIRKAVNRVQAHLLEFWLFADDPRAIWKPWKGLLAANARLLGRLLVPLLLMSLPGLPLFFFLDNVCGTAPLPVGKPALVTVGYDARSPVLRLRAPDGISIEGPPVRVFSQRQVSWRIRPLRPLSGEIECIAGGTEQEMRVVAGSGFDWHAPRRVQSWLAWIRDPAQPPLPPGPVSWIEISYPRAAISLGDLEMPWFAAFSAFSVGGALLAFWFGRLLQSLASMRLQ